MSRAEIASNSSPIDFLLFPFRLIWGFIVFMIFAWTTSRSMRPFIFSFPAIAGLIVFIAAAWAAGFKGKQVALGRSFGTYIEMSNEASPFHDTGEAVNYVRKASELEPLEPFYKHELGLAYERVGRIEGDERAYNVMSWLAPSKADEDADNAGNGHSDSHLWMAGYHWSNEELPEEQRKALAREHMELSYEANPENVYAVLGLAGMNRDDSELLRKEIEKLEEEGGDKAVIEQKKRQETIAFDRAVDLFKQGISLPLRSDRQLYASLAIIEMLQKKNLDADAIRVGQQFIIKHEKNAHLYPDALPFWISIVRTCMLINEYDKANEFIIRGYQLASNPEVRQILAQLAAQIKVEESKTFEDMDDEIQFLKKLFALCNAIKTNVQVLPAYRELMYFIDQIEPGSDQEFWIRDSILGSSAIDANEQTDPGIIHVILGFREIVSGRKKNGMEHWEIASQQFDYTPLSINFMIQVYSTERKLARNKKLHLANCGIQRFPQSAFFYATRGRFHLDDGYFEEAAEDMRFANERIPGNINILENLLQALEKLQDEKGNDADRASEIEQINAELEQIRARIQEPEGDKLSKFVQDSPVELESPSEDE